MDVDTFGCRTGASVPLTVVAGVMVLGGVVVDGAWAIPNDPRVCWMAWLTSDPLGQGAEVTAVQE